MPCWLTIHCAGSAALPRLVVGPSLEVLVDNVSSLIVALAYLAIFATLLYMVARSRGTLPFGWLYLVVGALVSIRAVIRFLDTWGVQSYVRWVDIALTVVSTVAAVAIAIALPLLMPGVLAVVRNAQLADERRRQLVAQTTVLQSQADLLRLAYDAILVRRVSDDVTTYWNPGAVAMYGWTEDEAGGVPIHTLLHSQFPCPFQEIEAALAASDRWEGEVAQIRRDGTRLVVESRWALQRDAHGQPLAYLEINRDITQRQHTMAALQEQQASLAAQFRAANVARSETRAVLDATEEAMGLLAPDGRMLIANQRVEDLLGLPVGTLIGRTLAELQPEVERVFEDPAMLQTLTELVTDPSRQVMQDIRQRWPQERELAFYSVPALATDGELLGRLFAFRDVTREHAADRAKSEFVSLVSHSVW